MSETGALGAAAEDRNDERNLRISSMIEREREKKRRKDFVFWFQVPDRQWRSWGLLVPLQGL